MGTLRALGNKVSTFEGFDTFKAPIGVSCVVAESDEVTSLCPITNQPDWYRVRVKYSPHDFCLESKTLKLYFHSLRDSGVFCEALAAQVADDIFKAILPTRIEVEVIQKPRGGISIISTAIREI